MMGKYVAQFNGLTRQTFRVDVAFDFCFMLLSYHYVLVLFVHNS
jgi:hypothetical protein